MHTHDLPSPSHEPRPEGVPVDILLLHYTGMESEQAAIDRLRDPTARVSAHYLISEDGRVARMVPENRRAWHAGVACWAGASDINSRSIGIELVNPGHEFGYRPFAPGQMDALATLARAILARHPIPSHRVLGHSDVAPDRKQDPGELFDWRGLAAAGVGLWPEVASQPRETPRLGWFRDGLATLGYCLPAETQPLAPVLTAFQRHFRPEAVTGEPDRGTAARLKGLLALLDRVPPDA